MVMRNNRLGQAVCERTFRTRPALVPRPGLVLLALASIMLAAGSAMFAQEHGDAVSPPTLLPHERQIAPIAIVRPEEISVDISAQTADDKGQLLAFPPDHAKELFGRTSQASVSPTWTPRFEYTDYPISVFNHRPLYFEDANLERYGRTHGAAQIVISGARFYGSVIALPYKMSLDPPQSYVSNDRYWVPPSECGPRFIQRPPLNTRAGLWQAGAVVGLVFLIP